MRFFRSILITIGVFLGLHTATLADSLHAPILFMVLEAGETRALEQVMRLLDYKGKAYSVLAFGTAARLLEKHPYIKPHLINVRDACNFKANLNQKTWEPTQRIPESDIKRLSVCLKPEVLVVGTSSMAQAQVSKALAKNKSKVIAFYDRLHPLTSNTVAQSVTQHASTILVAAQDLAKGFEHPASQQIKALGHPSMEVWRHTMRHSKQDAVRESIGLIGSNKPVLLYIGGSYGEGYEQSFEIFVKSLPELKDMDVLISIHPKEDGETERAILALHGATNYHILPSGFSSIVAGIADYVVSQRSTVGIQAYFANIPVIYLNTDSQNSKNLLVEKGAAIQVASEHDFLNAIRKIKENGRIERSPEEITRLTGIPLDSAHKIAAEIIAALP